MNRVFEILLLILLCAPLVNATEESPQRRYMVVPEERQARITVRKAMEEMVELNQGQPYTYDRDALIAMLDELLAASKQ